MKKSLSVVSWVKAASISVLLVAVPAAAVAGAPQPDQRAETGPAVKVGVGMGIPYGVIGTGIDVGLPRVSLVAGLGSALAGGLGWGAGVRVYFFDRTRRFRPHLTAMYGTTMIVEVGRDDGYTVNGFAFYGGLDHDIGPVGGLILTYGVGLLTNEVPPAGVPDPRVAVKVMLGINYRFGGR
jgi:hypothetical protein